MPVAFLSQDDQEVTLNIIAAPAPSPRLTKRSTTVMPNPGPTSHSETEVMTPRDSMMMMPDVPVLSSMNDLKGPDTLYVCIEPPATIIARYHIITLARRTLPFISNLYDMSAFARSPESHAAWQQLKRNLALRLRDDEQRAQRDRGIKELHRLLPRTSIPVNRPCSRSCSRRSEAFHSFVSSPTPLGRTIWEQNYIELQESPTPERLE